MEQPGLLDSVLDHDRQAAPRRWLWRWFLLLIPAALIAGLVAVAVDVGRNVSHAADSVRGGLGLDRPALDPHAALYRAYAAQKLGTTVHQATATLPSTVTDRTAAAQQFRCLNDLWDSESGWNPTAQNPESTAYGIAQFLEQTWTLMGVAKTSDPDQQIDAGLAYIAKRYGTPCDAWNFWQENHWY